MDRKLRAGLIGLGAMGKHHARVLTNLEGVELVGTFDLNSNSDLSSSKQASSIKNLIDLGIDYAVVATPTSSHLEIGMELASAGINALIEKPLCIDSLSAKTLTESFKNSGLIGAVGHIERYNSALQEAKNRLPQLGQIFQIATRRQGTYPTRINDVGVIKDLATHDIDSVSWITGQDYKKVFAQVGQQVARLHEDLVAITADLNYKIVVNHLVNWLSPYKERVTVITGENGAFLIDTLNSDLTFFENGSFTSNWESLKQFKGASEGRVTKYSFVKNEPLRLEHENFRDGLLGKRNEIVTMQEGLKVLQVVEAVIQSSQTNMACNIQYTN